MKIALNVEPNLLRVFENGRLYYTFNDPATSGAHKTGKLYVDAATSMLFRPPVGRPQGMVYERSYQISRVTPYRDEGFSFKEETGDEPTAPAHR